MIDRVEPPIDPDRCAAAIDLDPARDDDRFPIGLAPQHLEACAAKGAQGGGLADPAAEVLFAMVGARASDRCIEGWRIDDALPSNSPLYSG
jgi:hypothetical protein